MAKANGLRSMEWAHDTLDRVYRDLDAQNEPYVIQLTFNRRAVRFPLTEVEDYAIGLHDWYSYTLFNLGVEHENETIKARTVVISLSLGNDGSLPASKFEVELLDKNNLAQRGVRDPDVLRTMTLKEFER
jgi:hypothetical protein